VIEADLYGDLAFDAPRPLTAKSFDRKGLVLLCSSASKALARGYRMGWISARRFQAEVGRLKLITSMAAPSLPQWVVAEFMSSGGYDRHLKKLRTALAGQVETLRQAAYQCFPKGTRISRPAGGHMLWIELPAKIDAMKLWRAALVEHIAILPGPTFSCSRTLQEPHSAQCGNRAVGVPKPCAGNAGTPLRGSVIGPHLAFQVWTQPPKAPCATLGNS